jgi:hypothetical protein
MEPDAHCQGLPEDPGLSSELDTVLAVEYILWMGGKAKSAELLDGNVLTQHVTTLILTAALIANVRRDTKIHDEVDLTRVLLGIQAADEEEANAIGKNLGQVLQLAAQSWERKQLLRDSLEAEVETYATANQHSPEQKSENSIIPKSEGKTITKSDKQTQANIPWKLRQACSSSFTSPSVRVRT